MNKLSKIIKLNNCLKDLIYFYKYIKPFQLQLIVILTLSIASVVLTIISPYLLKSFVDGALINKDKQLMIRILLLMTIVNIFGTLVNFIITYLNGFVTGKIMISIRKDTFKHIIHLPYLFFTDNKVGNLLQKVNNEIDNIHNFVSNSLIRLMKNTLMIIGCIGALCLLNYKLFLIILITAPLSAILLLYFRPKLKNILEIIRSKDADIISFFIECFDNIKLVQTYNTFQYEENRLDGELASRFSLGMKRIKLLTLNSMFMGFIVALSTIILFSYGGYLVIDNILTVGALLAFMNYMMYLAGPVKDMQSMYMEYIRVTVSMDRLKEIFNTETILQKNKNRIEQFSFIDKIEIKDLQFAYKEGNILRNLDLVFEKGNVYALVGPSGSGKSTLMNIIVQFYQMNIGEIYIDGTSLENINIFQLRDNITYISQDNNLFNDTIIENIKRGNLSSEKQDIMEACKQVDIQFTNEKYQIKLGDKGSKISGGEKQRIALARAFLKKKDILILDEAFGSLDSDSEKTILNRLREFYKNNLIIVVSHRLSTIKDVDEIIYLSNGRIIERGKHDYLITKKGEYYKLFNEQLLYSI